MFNLDGNYSYYVGNDIFSDDNNSIVYFKDFTIFDGVNLIDISDSEKPEFEDLIIFAAEYYDLCEKILKVNYFKK